MWVFTLKIWLPIFVVFVLILGMQAMTAQKAVAPLDYSIKGRSTLAIPIPLEKPSIEITLLRIGGVISGVMTFIGFIEKVVKGIKWIIGWRRRRIRVE